MFDWMSKKFFIRTILLLIIASYITKLMDASYLSDTLLLGMIAHSIGLISISSWKDVQSKKEAGCDNEKNIDGFNGD